MSRDHRTLRVFQSADAAVEAVYRHTQPFPASERFGLQTQMRRAAVFVACNIVEGCARRSPFEYLNFLNLATGSAAEVAYLVGLSRRLGFLTDAGYQCLAPAYAELTAALKALVSSLEGRG